MNGTGPTCPSDMALVGANLCVDKWEASRPDATAWSFGSDSSHATSRAGVLPWLGAGLIGATAGYGMLLAALRAPQESPDAFMQAVRPFLAG